MAKKAPLTPPPAIVQIKGTPVVMSSNWLEERQAQHRFFAELHAALRGETKSA